MWKHRNPPLIGSIHIIKSLASSQLVYYSSSLPNTNEKFFVKLDKILYSLDLDMDYIGASSRTSIGSTGQEAFSPLQLLRIPGIYT